MLTVVGSLALDSDADGGDSRLQARERFRRNFRPPWQARARESGGKPPHSMRVVASERCLRCQRRAISTFPRFPQQKFFLVVLTTCASRATRVVRERSDRPSLGKHGKRKLDELHGAREAGMASAKYGAVQRHGEALGLDQRWAGRAPVRQLMEGATQTTDLT
jgi:hypothetical protein